MKAEINKAKKLYSVSLQFTKTISTGVNVGMSCRVMLAENEHVAFSETYDHAKKSDEFKEHSLQLKTVIEISERLIDEFIEQQNPLTSHEEVS